ncbi:MAG: lysylphosphatidylglycerol synthase domain-containing protein [Bdellovibrionota bacterium]
MKFFLKSAVLILISAIIIYFMSKNNLLQISSLKIAFVKNPKILYLIFFLQIFSCILMTLRYFSILKIFDIHVDFKNVTAATFVSNGLGLWLPGSMAFIEIIRIGLMLGAENKVLLNTQTQIEEKNLNKNPVTNNKEQLSLRSRLTTVSLFDRLIGLWCMLFVGLCVLGYHLLFSFQKITNSYQHIGIISIFIFTFLLLIFITFLPYFSKNIITRKIVTHIERLFLTFFRRGLLHKLFKKIFFEIGAIFDAIAIGGKKLNKFFLPSAYSFLCVFIQAISVYYAALAISSFIPFSAILATISIVAVATLVPMGFGGIGGVQFVAAISMSFFGVIPHSAASAQLLQTAINLLSISFAGIFFSKITSKQIKSMLKIYQIKNLNKN